LTVGGRLGAALAVDDRLYGTLRLLPHARRIDRALAAYSTAAEHGRLWVALTTAGAIIDRRRRREWVRAAVAVAATEALAQAIKRAVRRERPAKYPPLAATPSRFSFPSAHSATGAAAATALADVVPPTARWVPTVVMALSRPYLGVHYPSDVVAGLAVGSAIGAVARR
jgi:membrane-associated phospholipid phosphatase